MARQKVVNKFHFYLVQHQNQAIAIMAAGMKKTLDDMRKEVTCAVCFERYSEPKVLPCCHYYCKGCILKLASKAGPSKPFSCPECRKDTVLPEGGIDEFTTAFFISRLESFYSTMERAQGTVEVKCEACISEAKAESFCRQCAVFICNECVKSHQRFI